MRTRLPVIALSGVLLLGTAGALAQAEADRRLDAAIERLRGALGPEVRIEIGGRRLDPVSGRATLTDVVIHRGGDRTTIPEVILTELSETRIGRAELLRISERAEDGSAADTGRVVLSGLVLPPAGQRLDYAGIAFDGLEIESFRGADQGTKVVVARLAVRDWRDLAMGAGTLEGFDYQTSDGEAFRLRRLALEAVALPFAGTEFAPGTFRAGRIALEGAELRAADQAGEGALDRLELRDWAPGRPLSLVLEGLRGSGQLPDLGASTFRLGRIEASGLDGAHMLTAILQGQQVPDPSPGVPQRVVIEGLDSTAEGQPFLSLRRLLTEATLEAGIIGATLQLDGFRLVLPRGQADALEALGYREVAGGIEFRSDVPRAGGRLNVDPFRIAWEEAATLGITVRLDDFPALPEAGAEVDDDAALAGLVAMRLAALSLTLRDQGLIGRVLARQARAQRIPEARLREQWAQLVLATPLPGSPQSPPPARPGAAPPKAATGPDPILGLRQAIAAFIRQPGTLEIALRPPTPLAFGEMVGLVAGDTSQAAERLGLTATAR